MPTSLKRFAIIGRPNVGKSTFFNLLTETRNAVVKNRPGVTRDIQSHEAEVWGQPFEIVDTGGVTDAADVFSVAIKKQVGQLLGSVDYLLLVLDGKYGLCPEDRDIVRLAQASGKEFLTIINKVDRPADSELIKSEFYELGVELVDASFERRFGLNDIFEWISARAEVTEVEELSDDDAITIAVVGKPNAGKSSLCNYLLGHEKMLVSDIAGTTVDSIDSVLEFDGNRYILSDTAGLRRSSKRVDDVEIISSFKSHQAIDRSDLVLVVVDGLLGPSAQDQRIVEYVLEQHKAVILVVNKTDLGQEKIPEFRKTTREKIAQEFHFFPDIPISFISAKTGLGVQKLFSEIQDIWSKLNVRISTRELNDFFTRVIRQAPAPVYGNKNVKFYYLTQTKQVPPSFIAFANFPDGVNDAYRRFLAKKIQKNWDLSGVPIRIFSMKAQGSA